MTSPPPFPSLSILILFLARAAATGVVHVNNRRCSCLFVLEKMVSRRVVGAVVVSDLHPVLPPSVGATCQATFEKFRR